jgi:hypothetical protein
LFRHTELKSHNPYNTGNPVATQYFAMFQTTTQIRISDADNGVSAPVNKMIRPAWGCIDYHVTLGFTVQFFMDRVYYIINTKIKMKGYYNAIANSFTIT